MRIPGLKNKWIRLPLKILLWILVGVFTLVILVVLALQLPPVQNFAAQKAVNFLQQKIHAEVSLGSINIGFPKTINLKKLYIADKKNDTLLSINELNVGVDMLGLLSNNLYIRSVELKGVTGRIERLYPDTTFNYSFILDAFASQDTSAPTSDTSAAMVIGLKKVKLENVYFVFNDTLSGSRAGIRIGEFTTEFEEFDLQKMLFKVGEIELLNSGISYLQTPPLIKSVDTGSTALPDLGFGIIRIENFSADYKGPASGNALQALIGQLEVESDKIDLINNRISLKKILLAESDIRFQQSKPQQFDTIVAEIAQEQGTEKLVATPEWVFTLGDLELRNNKAAYDNTDSAAAVRGIDFNHMLVTELNLKSGNLNVSPGKITLNMEGMGFAEKSGFRLQQFASHISYDTTNITLANLTISTPYTHISNHLEAGFSSITGISESPEKVQLRANLKDVRIALKDVLYFMPDLASNPQVKITGNEVIAINGNINGSLEELSINGLKISNGKSTNLALTGLFRNVMNPEQMYASVQDINVNTTRSDIYAYAGKGLIPDDISVPDQISIAGSYRGYMSNFNTDMLLRTSYGNVSAKVRMDPSKGNYEVPYTINLNVDRMDLGRLLNQPDTLGPVTLQLQAHGTGLKPDSLNAEVRATVQEAYYNKYNYHDLNIEGFVVNRSFHGEIWMHDNNLDFNYTGYANLNPDSLAVIFDLNIAGADLQALNLSPGVFKFSGSVSSNLAKRYGPNPLGKLKIYDVNVMRDALACPVDSIIIESAYRNDSSIITLRSQILSADFRGDVVLQELPNTIMNHFNRYFAFLKNDTIAKTTASDSAKGKSTSAQKIPTADSVVQQDFTFKLTMEDPNQLCENLLPALRDFEPLTVQGRYNSAQMHLEANAEVPRFNFSDVVIDSLNIRIKSDQQKLDYELHVAEISNPALALELFDLTGSISDNRIRYNINAAKSDTFNVLRTGGAYAKEGEDEYVLIMDEPLILNNTAWNIDPDNKITFDKKGLNADRVILSGGDQLISLITQPGDNVPLKIAFENFRLSNLSVIVEKDKPLARGELNGHFILFKVNGISAFTSDLAIDSLRFMDIPVGNITLLADNSRKPEQFDVDFRLSGYGNNLTAAGYYLAHDSIGELNMAVDIPRLNMAAIEPFTFGQVTRMSGFLSGGLEVGGTTKDPDINGQLRFNEVAFQAPYANTYLRVPNNLLIVGNKRVLFDNLTLIDTVDNKATVNGFVDFTNLTKPRFDMRINTEDFLAMNSHKSNGEIPLYGTLILDSDIHVTGTPAAPVVDMKVQLDNGTRIVYVMPETQYTLNEGEGIVEFTDSLSYRNEIMQTDSIAATTASATGITLNAAITFEPEAVLKMMVDPMAGDSMYVSGEGTLNFTLNPGGQMNLTGRYDINDGGYNITLNELIKRQFTLSEGSSITWTGDIMDALVDLKAIYRVRTSPLILLEDQLAGADDSERNQYRNTLTFLVYLEMTGNLLKPDIKFDIDQPENEKGAMGGAVNSKLNELKTDESQLNKQVFALLTLNRFLGQDPFETGNAPLTVESATRASASKILTQQFSALSEKYIKGVDLDVGVNSFEDYSSGTEQGRTQLQLGVSKEFLNDRITVQVGGNVELEGEKARENRTSDIAGNVNVEYKLTPNGRYRLRAFRRIEYENPIESELINTGVGFSYSRDFRKLRQVFWSKERLAERRQQIQQERMQQNKTNEKQ